jgi:hypothetical protein
MIIYPFYWRIFLSPRSLSPASGTWLSPFLGNGATGATLGASGIAVIGGASAGATGATGAGKACAWKDFIGICQYQWIHVVPTILDTAETSIYEYANIC